MDQAGIQQLLAALAEGTHARETPAAGAPALRETHISWVILAGEFAYKIKKPVDFGFLDFTTLEQRRHFCEEEIRLNRRFAPELYLRVVPVTRGMRGVEIAGEGPVVDYAVRMRRFDECELLDRIAERGELDLALLRALAREMARLHDELAPCHPDPEGDEPGTPAALFCAVEQNFRQIRAYPLEDPALQLLDEVERWSLERYHDLLPVMRQRVRAGRVIDGHGDAHLGNIARVAGKPVLFDCIEFNPAFRIMDGIGETAFLTMDLEARGYVGEAHRLLTDYLEYRGDYGGLAVLDFYRCYSALVRAKVNLLRESPGGPGVAATDAYRAFRRYLELAHRYSRGERPFFAITHGVSGSGKSTVAGNLVAASGAVRVRSDVERKRLFGLAPEQRSDAADVAELYSSGMSRRTFAHLQELAELIVTAGFPVIVDATFLHRPVRDTFRVQANRLGVPFAIIDCRAEVGVLRERLLARQRLRQDASEAGVAVMESQLSSDEPLAGDELAFALEADSAEAPASLWKRFRRLCFGEC
jgi:aminoglycoside phosphotransferase family enzyme/predicted kinase